MINALYRLTVAFAVVVVASASAADAERLDALGKGNNDGVFSLNTQQQAFFGVANATHVGFYRVRVGETGDFFDAASVLNSTKQDAAKILSVRNGANTGLDYTGAYLEELGVTTLLNDSKNFFRGVAFLFNENAGNIVFNNPTGTSTFNSGQSQGVLDYTPIPLPAAGWLLLAGAGGLVAAKRRQRQSV